MKHPLGSPGGYTEDGYVFVSVKLVMTAQLGHSASCDAPFSLPHLSYLQTTALSSPCGLYSHTLPTPQTFSRMGSTEESDA